MKKLVYIQIQQKDRTSKMYFLISKQIEVTNKKFSLINIQ
jgi:hypothetical protein